MATTSGNPKLERGRFFKKADCRAATTVLALRHAAKLSFL